MKLDLAFREHEFSSAALKIREELGMAQILGAYENVISTR